MTTDTVEHQRNAGDAVERIVGVVVLVLIFALGPAAYNWLVHDSHWIHHEQLMLVYADSWTTGDYKDCDTLNIRIEKPPLNCDTYARGKTFNVRFDSDTYLKEKPDSTVLHWKCGKHEGGDATFDCELKFTAASRPVSIGFTEPHPWTSENEPPGRVVPQHGTCPGVYKPIDHMSGPGGYVRHVDCVPAPGTAVIWR